MARKPADRPAEVVELVHTKDADNLDRRSRDQLRRAEALSSLMAGLSHEQVAERMGTTPEAVENLVDRTLGAVAQRGADDMRNLENLRLDRAQAAIWSQVLQGDTRAIDVFLRISQRRAKMNGLDEPTRISLAVSVRAEMEQAFAQLEQLVLADGMVVDADE